MNSFPHSQRYQYSAHYYFDFGNKKLCQLIEGSTYFIATMNMTDIPYSFPMGFCLPKACEDKDDNFLADVNKRVTSAISLVMDIMQNLWDWDDLRNNKFFTPTLDSGTSDNMIWMMKTISDFFDSKSKFQFGNRNIKNDKVEVQRQIT